MHDTLRIVSGDSSDGVSEEYAKVEVVSCFKVEAPVYDFEVPKSHLYLGSGGIVSHNSTLMLSVCRSMADRGHKSLYAASEMNSKLVGDMGLTNEKYAGFFNLVACTTYSDLENLMWSFFESDRTLMVIDSITAVVPSKMLNEGSVEDSFVGLVARIRGEFLRLMNGNIQKYDKAIVFLNQARANFDAGWNGESIVPEGGYSNEHYANILVTIRGDAKVQDLISGDSKKVVGKIGHLYTTKNRAALPFVKIPLQLFFGKGASNIYSLTHYLQWRGAVETKGAWYEINFNGCSERVSGKSGRHQWVKGHQKEILEDFSSHALDYFNALAAGFEAKV
jgi:hypothetical protein